MQDKQQPSAPVNSKKFCARCYDAFMANQVVRSNGGLAAYVNPREMVFGCKIPRFTHDGSGNPVVHVMDCHAGREKMLTHKDYLHRRARGEL